jgi:hypothetical protein
MKIPRLDSILTNFIGPVKRRGELPSLHIGLDHLTEEFQLAAHLRKFRVLKQMK